MGLSFKHAFTNPKGDPPDTTVVRPSNWNDEHTATMDADNLLGRATAGNGPVEQIQCTSFARTLLAQTAPGGVSGLMPVGGVTPFAGAAAPTGWLLCDGSAVSRTTYAALFAVLGIVYGAGDGATTFNVPDAGGRVMAGKESVATRLTTAGSGVDGATLGAVGGGETHTLTAAESAVLTYTSTVTDLGHVHPVRGQVVGGGLVSPSAASALTVAALATGSGAINNITNAGADGQPFIQSATTDISVGTTSDAGGGAHANVQPTMIMNYIVFAGA